MTSSALEKLLAETGTTKADFELFRKQGAKTFSKEEIKRNEEFERIYRLPRRQVEDIVPQEVVEALSAYFRAPTGKQTLRPLQAAALIEMHDYGGLMGMLTVGGGKTLISLVGFIVLEAKRPLLIVPAKLIEKTRREMYAMRTHWLVPPYVRIISYEILGREQAAKLIQEINPDVIICDEVHRLKNTKAAVTKRVKRWMEEHPETKFVGLSGTVTKRSLHDYAHLMAWALKKTNPTPKNFNDRMLWAAVLDEKRKKGPDMDVVRVLPGALSDLCNEEELRLMEDDPIHAVRLGYRRRLTETPGVIATKNDTLSASLSIESEVLSVPELAEDLASLRKWMRPDGEPVLDAIELWRHMREMACGFFYRWNPMPPDEWRSRRRVWAKAVREILRTNRSGLDSEGQVQRAVEDEIRKFGEGLLTKSQLRFEEASEALTRWREISHTYEPKTEAVWRSARVVDYCAKWMEEEKGIVWVEHTEFGRALSQKTGIPYYQKGGLNSAGKPIEDHPAGTPLIASIASNGEGRNLQGWSTNLVVSPPTSGAVWEQLLGRTHRPGQEADEVSAKVLITIPENIAAFDGARADARYISATTGQIQKLSYADITFVTKEQM